MTSATVAGADPNRLGHDDGEAARLGGGETGPASTRVIVGYGFWIFLLSDIIMFSAFFAAFAVLASATAGGPAARDLFDLDLVAIETACLLTSSFTCGLASIAAGAGTRRWTQVALAATAMLGVAFLALEISEFVGLIAKDAGPHRSAFLSAFFALVGLHGAHVMLGLVWLMVMMAQVATKGFTPQVANRILCFTLFWHALDIVWVGVVTNVYLIGTLG